MSVRSILFAYTSHPEAPETPKNREAAEHLHAEASVPQGSSLTPPPLPFHALRNARQTSKRASGIAGRLRRKQASL